MRSRSSPRLTLRPYTIGDLDELYAIQSRPEVCRYLYWTPRDREQVLESLRQKINATALDGDGDTLTFAVVLADTGQLIGDVQLILLSRVHRQGEIGYVFHPDLGGHGYATEAAKVVLQIGFEEYRLHRIVGRIDGRNTASARVLERLGMRREAHFVQNEFVKSEWTDEVVYAMLAREWQARRSSSSSQRLRSSPPA